MTVGKTNPLRQQMINMMYLVLTALLALNVSAEILQAFATVNVGMKNAIDLIDQKNAFSMREFKKLYDKSPAGVKDFFDCANNCNKVSDDFYNYIENLKNRIIQASGGFLDPKNPDIYKRTEIKRESDLNVPANIMIREKQGDETFNRIQKARMEYISIIKKIPSINYNQFLPNITVDAKKPTSGSRTWAEINFHMVPTIAAVTLLTKIQNDIRNTQANILDALINSIGKEDISFDQLTPVFQTDKSSVAVGEKFTANVFLAAYDTKQQPEIYIGGQQYEVKDGMAKYEVVENSQGSRDIPIVIKQTNKKTGEIKEYTSSMKYDVFNAPATISATKMNVVYIGLDNPIEVSVPGFRPADIAANISGGGTLRPDKNPGNFMCNVPDTRGSVKEVVITASVKLPGGGVKVSGSKNFRIRNMPRPTPMFGSKEGGEIGIGEIHLVQFIRVALNDFAFEGINYTVTKFDLLFAPQKGQVKISKTNGSRLNQEMLSFFANPNPGDKIIVTNIYAKPYGNSVVQSIERKVGDLVLTVK